MAERPLDGKQSPTSPRLRPRGPPVGKRVVIIGGGIGGLTAARALLDAGCEVAVFDRRSLDAMLSGPSGLGLVNNAINALSLLSGKEEGASLAEEVAAAGVEDRWFNMTTPAGTKLQTFPMGGVPSIDGSSSSGCYSLTRPNLQRTLYAALPPGTVTCNASFRSFGSREDGRVEVTLALSGDSSERADSAASAGSLAASPAGAQAIERVEVCDLLVGADGIRSGVRTCLEEHHGIEARQPVYSGYSYNRGLVDLSRWPGGVAGWQKQWAGVHLVYGACGAGIMYQVTPDTLCFGRYAPAPQGTYAPGAMDPAKAKVALEELCRDYHPMHELSLMVEPHRIACGELWQLPPPKDVWGTGCVTLLGDAAHAMLPALGQGACQAIEDAVELAVTLHQAAAAKAASSPIGSSSAELSPADLAAALRRYEAVRGPHTARVRNLAEATFKHAAGDTWWARFKRECWFRLAPVSWMRPAVSWMTQRHFSWGCPPAEAA